MLQTEQSIDWKAAGKSAFISLPSATLEGYTRESGLIISYGDKIRYEEIAGVDGTVISCGDKLDLPIKAGDNVAVSYKLTSDFTQDDNGVPSYNRAHIIKDQLVWKAERFHFLAVWRDDHWEALGDYTIIEPSEIPNPAYINSTLIIPDNQKTVIEKNKAVFRSGDLPIASGKTVIIRDSISSKYTFPDNKEYVIIHKDFILGVID